VQLFRIGSVIATTNSKTQKMKFFTLLLPLLFFTSVQSYSQECPNQIEVLPTENCLSYYFSLNGDAFGNVMWDFSDAGAEASGVGIDHTYLESGTYTVCANPISMDCDPICTTIEVFCPECDIDIEIMQQSDSLLILQAFNYSDGAEIHWFQNGTQVNVGYITTFLLESGNNIICGSYETPECPQGVEWCETFVLETDPQDDCPTEIEVIQGSDCLTYYFSLNNQAFGNVLWDFSEAGAEDSGVGIDHTYSASGTYTVCANPISMDCNPICTTVEVVCNECDMDIEVMQQTDSLLVLQAFNYSAGAQIHWTHNGVQVNIGFVTTFLLQPGNNEICAFYETLDCPQGVLWCETFVLETGPVDDCPTQIEVLQGSDCLSFYFSLNNPAFGDVLWDFSDAGGEISGIQIDHTYAASGTYTVCANPITMDCDPICTTVEVICSDCPTTITYTTINECGVYMFNLNNFGDFGNILWSWGDGASSSGGNNVGHAFFEPGTYDVCVEAWTSDCPEGVEICIPVVVPDCEIECPGELVATELECGVWEFSIEPGSAVMGAVWLFGDGTVDDSNGNSIIHQFDSAGVYVVTVNSNLNQPCFNNYFTVTIVVEECGEFECPNEMIVTEDENCGAYNFTVNNSGSIDNIIWYWGDGFVGGGNQINAWHNYQEAGTYQVCAEITAENCSDNVYEICQTIVVPECPPCPTGLMFEQDSCNVYTFWLENGYSFGQVQWNFGNNIVTVPGNEYVTVSLETGLNLIYAIYTAPNNPECSGETYFVEIEVDDCLECPTSLNIQEMTCGYYYFMGWGAAGEEIDWSFTDGGENYEYTTTNNGLFSHLFSASGNYEICAVYSSNDCPDGVELCETISIPDCNPDDCTLTLTYANLGNGLFSFIAEGSGAELPLFWDYGNGETMNATWVTQHQFEPGIYTVCASYESPTCTFPVTACVTIVVPEIEECLGYMLSFLIEMNAEGFSVVEFTLEDENGFQFQGGTFFVSEITGFFQGAVCLPNGCYTLDISSLSGLGIDVSSIELFNSSIPFDGEINIVEINGSQVEVQIDINGDCDFSTGINDDILGDIQVYPIPATDVLNIVIPAGEQVEATIFSSTGQLIYKAQLNQSLQLNTTNWASGLYLLRLENNNSIKTQRIQKF
jgi:PKD repeat protein